MDPAYTNETPRNWKKSPLKPNKDRAMPEQHDTRLQTLLDQG